MADRYYNYFSRDYLLRPTAQNGIYDTLCQGRESSRRQSRTDLAPFPRMVDLWFLGFCIASREGIKPKDLPKETSRIIDGTIFDGDPGRMEIIMLVAIDIADNVHIVGEPGKMMRIANSLAAAGVPLVEEMLKGNEYPIWNLTDALDKMLR